MKKLAHYICFLSLFFSVGCKNAKPKGNGDSFVGTDHYEKIGMSLVGALLRSAEDIESQGINNPNLCLCKSGGISCAFLQKFLDPKKPGALNECRQFTYGLAVRTVEHFRNHPLPKIVIQSTPPKSTDDDGIERQSTASTATDQPILVHRDALVSLHDLEMEYGAILGHELGHHPFRGSFFPGIHPLTYDLNLMDGFGTFLMVNAIERGILSLPSSQNRLSCQISIESGSSMIEVDQRGTPILSPPRSSATRILVTPNRNAVLSSVRTQSNSMSWSRFDSSEGIGISASFAEIGLVHIFVEVREPSTGDLSVCSQEIHVESMKPRSRVIYRMSDSTADFFNTSLVSEGIQAGFSSPAESFLLFHSPTSVCNIPVHRARTSTNRHFVTIENGNGVTIDGILGYCCAQKETNTIALSHWWRPAPQGTVWASYLATIDPGERDNLVLNNYQYIGDSCYVPQNSH